MESASRLGLPKQPPARPQPQHGHGCLGPVPQRPPKVASRLGLPRLLPISVSQGSLPRLLPVSASQGCCPSQSPKAASRLGPGAPSRPDGFLPSRPGCLVLSRWLPPISTRVPHFVPMAYSRLGPGAPSRLDGFLPSRPELPLGHKCPVLASQRAPWPPSELPKPSPFLSLPRLGHGRPVPTASFRLGRLASLRVLSLRATFPLFLSARGISHHLISLLLSLSLSLCQKLPTSDPSRPDLLDSASRFYFLPGYGQLRPWPGSFPFPVMDSSVRGLASLPSQQSPSSHPTSWVRVLTRLSLILRHQKATSVTFPLSYGSHLSLSSLPSPFLAASNPSRAPPGPKPRVSPFLSPTAPISPFLPSLSLPLCLKPKPSTTWTKDTSITFSPLPSLFLSARPPTNQLSGLIPTELALVSPRPRAQRQQRLRLDTAVARQPLLALLAAPEIPRFGSQMLLPVSSLPASMRDGSRPPCIAAPGLHASRPPASMIEI